MQTAADAQASAAMKFYTITEAALYGKMSLLAASQARPIPQPIPFRKSATAARNSTNVKARTNSGFFLIIAAPPFF